MLDERKITKSVFVYGRNDYKNLAIYKLLPALYRLRSHYFPATRTLSEKQKSNLINIIKENSKILGIDSGPFLYQLSIDRINYDHYHTVKEFIETVHRYMKKIKYQNWIYLTTKYFLACLVLGYCLYSIIKFL